MFTDNRNYRVSEVHVAGNTEFIKGMLLLFKLIYVMALYREAELFLLRCDLLPAPCIVYEPLINKNFCHKWFQTPPNIKKSLPLEPPKNSF